MKGSQRGRPSPTIVVHAPVFRDEQPGGRGRIVEALTQILLADLEREAAEEARLSPSGGRVSPDRIEEARAS